MKNLINRRIHMTSQLLQIPFGADRGQLSSEHSDAQIENSVLRSSHFVDRGIGTKRSCQADNLKFKHIQAF
jgi:hypothetical protein